MKGTHYNAPDAVRGASPWWALAVIAAVVLFCALGVWQLNRAEEKREWLQAAQSRAEQEALRSLPAASDLPAALRFHPVELTGSYLSERQVLLDNMTLDGQVGYQVLTPLRLADGSLVMVNRGFVPSAPTRGELPDVAVDAGTRTVRGLLNELPQPGLRLGEGEAGAPGDPWPRVYLYPQGSLLAAALGEPVRHYQVQLDAGEADGFVRRWQIVSMDPQRHTGYAVQWFAFALTAVVIYVILIWRSRRRA